MVFDKKGIVSASREELLALWTFDDDIFRLFYFPEWVYWCEMVGVMIHENPIPCVH